MSINTKKQSMTHHNIVKYMITAKIHTQQPQNHSAYDYNNESSTHGVCCFAAMYA